VTGFQAFLHSLATWVHKAYLVLQPLVRAMWDTVGNVFLNKPEPARDVAVSLAALAVLAVFIPKIVKKVTK